MSNTLNPKAASDVERSLALNIVRKFKQSHEMTREAAQLYGEANRMAGQLGASCFDLANERLETELELTPQLITPFGTTDRLVISFYADESTVKDIYYITDDGKSHSLRQMADIYR